MPMIKCRECKHEMSTKADFCPHCGRRRLRQSNDGFALVIVIFVLFACIGVALLYMTGNQKVLKDMWKQLNGQPVQSAQQVQNPQQGSVTENRELWQQRSLDLVRNKMGDRKAELANVHFNLSVSGGVQIPVLCGDIVYPDGGVRKFITSADTNMAALEGEQQDFGRLWQGLCIKQ